MSRVMSRVVLTVGTLVCLAAGAWAQVTSTASETKKFEVIAVDGNLLVVNLPEGTREITVPAGFLFNIDGKQMSVQELKPGMKGTATITTTTTVTPVTVTEVKNGQVVIASGGAIYVRTGGDVKMFTQGDVDKRGVKIMRGGKPAAVADFRAGDTLSATIITSKPPQIVSEKEVQATLARAPEPAAAPLPAPAAPPAAAPPGGRTARGRTARASSCGAGGSIQRATACGPGRIDGAGANRAAILADNTARLPAHCLSWGWLSCCWWWLPSSSGVVEWRANAAGYTTGLRPSPARARPTPFVRFPAIARVARFRPSCRGHRCASDFELTEVRARSFRDETAWKPALVATAHAGVICSDSVSFLTAALTDLPHQIRVIRLSCVPSPSIPLEPAIRSFALQDAGVVMNLKLYVGNLPYEITESDLARPVRRRRSGQHRQYRPRPSHWPGAWLRICRDERRRRRTARHLGA